MNAFNKIASLSLIWLATAGMVACNKPDAISIEDENTIYMPQAVGTRSTVKLMLVDEPYDFVFGAAYGGLQKPAKDISLTFQAAPELIDAYNAEHGTSYQPLPAASYTVSGFTSVIKAGTTTSEPLVLAVKSKELQMGGKYLYPVRLLSASSGVIDADKQVTYFIVDDVIRKETDITRRATISVSNEYPYGANEASPKLIDGDLNSKYLTFDYHPGLWMQLSFTEAQVIEAYTFTSGGDAPDRDPKSWRVLGSNNGTDWDLLETRTNEFFPGRNFTRFFEFVNDVAYKYYRINVTEKNSGPSGLFQLSEWRVITFK